MTTPFRTFLKGVRQEDYHNIFRGILVCFDPGETTGLAIFRDVDLVHSQQLITKDLKDGSLEVDALFDNYTNPNSNQQIQVVMEDYRVYGWKTDQHAFAELHTAKFIGCILAICALRNIPVQLQMAQQAKGFCTDEKLKSWDMYQKNMRHARDAIRHGTYYQLFNKDMIYTSHFNANT